MFTLLQSGVVKLNSALFLYTCAGSLFGASSTPAFGSTGVFGAASAPPLAPACLAAASLAAAALLPLLLAASTSLPLLLLLRVHWRSPALGQQQQARAAVQPATVGQQPYGLLQPLPQVNVPEHKVGEKGWVDCFDGNVIVILCSDGLCRCT